MGRAESVLVGHVRSSDTAGGRVGQIQAERLVASICQKGRFEQEKLWKQEMSVREGMLLGRNL